MTIAITGDIHGRPIERFSFRKHPELRELKISDYMIILGDFGIPFGINAPWHEQDKKAEHYAASWLNSQKYTTIAICGNHDDRDAIADMPQVEMFGGIVRTLRFDDQDYHNIVIVDTPQILTIDGYKCLVIPGANSHDISDGILEPDDPDFDTILNRWSKDPFKRFRINHWSWWENEGVDIAATKELLSAHKDEHFDFILTHDCPSMFHTFFSRGAYREVPTESEKYFEELRSTLNFDCWMHGHMHKDLGYPPAEEGGDDRIMVLFQEILTTEGGNLD